MKKYLSFINENKKSFNNLNNLDDEDLIEIRNSLYIEKKDIEEEIMAINKILTNRKENKETKYSESLPKSIFEFDKDQLLFIFLHNDHQTKEKYNIQNRFYSQLKGVHRTGYNRTTNQTYFSISIDSFIEGNKFKNDEDVFTSINFLFKNLINKEIGISFSRYTYFDYEYIRYDGLNYICNKESYKSLDVLIRKLVNLELEDCFS